MMSLREARQRRNLTITELAARAGVGDSTIYRIEHGKAQPRPAAARRLCAALGLEPHQITEFRIKPRPDGEPGTKEGPPTVLVVDDDQPIRILVGELLIEEGYAVRYANNGLEALAEFAGTTPAIWSCPTSGCRGWTARRWSSGCARTATPPRSSC